jgi:hypothetical protein
MKRFVFSLIILLSISFTTEAKTLDYETPDITVIDDFSDCQLQVATVVTNQGNNYHCKGLDVLQVESYRHDASDTAIRHGKNISITAKVNSYTNYSKEQTCYSKPKESRQYDRGGMLLRRAEGSGKNLQGNYYTTSGDQYQTKRNFNPDTKRNELYTEALVLYRIGNRDTVFRYPVCPFCDTWHSEN